jgi:hypothetical protein
MNRRQFLWSTTALVASSLVSKFVGAQTADPKSTAPLTAPVKIEGNIGYNAGWVIPLEDQKALLELEAQKKKAAEAKDAITKPAAPAAPAITEANNKPAKKTWGEKAQGWLDSVKSWF